MWMIFILSGLVIIIFHYMGQKRKERREDRQDRLREMRQQQLDLLLGKDKPAPGDDDNNE